eukprot:GHVP01054049.1.p1 GENE.GHVP01054049.1~~GHVP01054049.1.p1  ORF type:complete len:413 (+),score=40.64 GHVP01054049.1:29-1267(+)
MSNVEYKHSECEFQTVQQITDNDYKEYKEEPCQDYSQLITKEEYDGSIYPFHHGYNDYKSTTGHQGLDYDNYTVYAQAASQQQAYMTPDSSVMNAAAYSMVESSSGASMGISQASTTSSAAMSIYASSHSGSLDSASAQKTVAFQAGPRERIHVYGNPVEHCPRCQMDGLGSTNWRPHRHVGELKIRYICERHFDDQESAHHFDIPLCPLCGQVLYLYDFNTMLGVSSARRLHKFVLKCSSRHVLPLLDLFCQTKRGGERCNANFKLQWCYGTMVKRCEAQKNRDHDLWWVRYKNEWKQRRTIIRYKKDFLSHLSDVQRALLLGLGHEGEPPPDPKSALGPTYDALVATVSSPVGPKIRHKQSSSDCYDYDLEMGNLNKRQRDSLANGTSSAMMQHSTMWCGYDPSGYSGRY